MKKLTTISLFIFGVIVTAILTAGLVFYQDKKDNQTSTATIPVNIVDSTIDQINSDDNSVTNKNTTTKPTTTTKTTTSIILNMEEIAKHNKQSDCWLLISDKVYNITSYFGSHPGGSGTMALTCGKDATAAYYTQDPYATSSSTRSAHSSRAKSLLSNYYLGDLNQTISE
jgi:cytochrome b involved in lipid metabolism